MDMIFKKSLNFLMKMFAQQCLGTQRTAKLELQLIGQKFQKKSSQVQQHPIFVDLILLEHVLKGLHHSEYSILSSKVENKQKTKLFLTTLFSPYVICSAYCLIKIYLCFFLFFRKTTDVPWDCPTCHNGVSMMGVFYETDEVVATIVSELQGKNSKCQ